MYLPTIVSLLVSCAFSAQFSIAEPRSCQSPRCQYLIRTKTGPRIQNKLQNEFLNKLLNTADYHEGFALFSYSGWLDRGQIMVLRKKSTANADVIYYRPNTRNNPQQKTLTQTDFNHLVTHLNNINNEKLHDFLPKVYDGIEYEYVRAFKATDSQIEVVARVYMKMPSLSKNKPNRYLQIVDAFTKLVEKFFQDE